MVILMWHQSLQTCRMILTCKPPLHDFDYHCLLSERSCDTGLQKSWTVWFGAEKLGMIIVPTTGAFPDKVFYTKCTDEEFVIGQVFRYRGVQWCGSCRLLYLFVSNPFYFPSVIWSRFRQVGISGGKKWMSENRDMTLPWRRGRGWRYTKFEVNWTKIETSADVRADVTTKMVSINFTQDSWTGSQVSNSTSVGIDKVDMGEDTWWIERQLAHSTEKICYSLRRCRLVESQLYLTSWNEWS